MNCLTTSILWRQSWPWVTTDRLRNSLRGMLEAQLKTEAPKSLAAERPPAWPCRGAIVFYQPALMCVRCHPLEDDALVPSVSGPELAHARQRPFSTYRACRGNPGTVRSRSKRDTKQLRSSRRTGGRTVSGLLVEDRPGTIVLRDPGRSELPMLDIQPRSNGQSTSGLSLMPAGLVNALASGTVPRPHALSDGDHRVRSRAGPSARPDPALLAPPLPDMKAISITPVDRRAGSGARPRTDDLRPGLRQPPWNRGPPGSLPSAPRFATATLKNGSDPFAMYRTLTVGFGQMAAQTWMVPQQKYDVIHYIREAYFKRDNSERNCTSIGDTSIGFPRELATDPVRRRSSLGS